MTDAIRALHFLQLAPRQDKELLEEIQATRLVAGCREAEAYRSIDDDSNVIVVELWESQQAYSDHWSNVLKSGSGVIVTNANNTDSVPSEFYGHQTFTWNNRWVATNLPESGSRIHWPNRDAVRITIQITVADGEGIKGHFGADVVSTRREPGCLAYDWMQSLEWPHHYLLNELWADQYIYDAHIGMRVKVAEGRGESYGSGPRPPAPDRAQGTNALEFYRQQAFRHLYDRWQPADVFAWSETVAWPD